MSAESRHAVMPIRRWLALALVTVFVVPVSVTVLFAILWVGEEPHNPREDAIELLQQDADRWSEPDWQAAIATRVASDNVDFVLFQGDSELFRTASDPISEDPGEGGTRVVEKVVIADTSPQQTALVYADEQLGPPEEVPVELLPIVGLGTLGLTLAGIAVFFGRTILRPLAATSEAARSVARGELDITLPNSRVREVAEVNTAFEAMGAGLRESLRQQAALEEERRFFIGAIAHDLRTPLFSLRGYLDGLREGVADTEEKRQHYLNVAQEKANALEYLIAELFEFTRLEYLEQTPDRESLDLGALLVQVVEGVKPLAANKPVSLKVDAPEDDCVIQGDPRLLTRVVENLLDNAIRHTPPNGKIEVSSRQDSKSVTFCVADTGPGIPESDMPQIFSPLFRGEVSRNRRTGGAGLGLTIARRIVRAHGGELIVSNRPTGGAEFIATLPRS